MKRILGLDYGSKRIGVAISDPLRITAQPVGTIQYSSLEKLWAKMDGLWKQYEIEAVVVGLPLNMDGSTGPSYQKAEWFGKKLSEKYQTSVWYWDERLTSLQAEQTLRELRQQPSRRKEAIDQLAAVFILQGYLDRQRNRLSDE